MKKLLQKINLTPRQLIDILLIIILLIVFAQNVEDVKFNFLFFKFDLPLIIIIASAYFIGFFTSKVFTKKKVKHDVKATEDEAQTK